MYLLGTLLWVFLSGLLAYGIGRLLTSKLKSRWWRWMLAAVLLPLIFMAPLADEIVGKYQFDQLCESADKEARIYGTIPVGEELYTPGGEWRLGITDSWGDRMALNEIIKSLLRWESKTTQLHMAILIQQYDEQIFARNTGRLLAQWRTYGTAGGRLSHSFETPFLVRSTCTPRLINPIIDIQLLPFTKVSTK